MTLEETLKRMQELSSSFAQAKDQAEDAEFNVEDNSKQDENKEVEAKKADTGTIYMGLANKGQTTQQPQNVNGVNIWTGDKEGSVLNGRKFIHPTKGAQILTSDKSDLLTTGQVEVKRKDGKGVSKVPFIGVKSDAQGNPDPDGDNAIPTDIDTILKLEKGQTTDLVVSNGNALQNIGDDNKALAVVDKETKELANIESNLPATTTGNALAFNQNDLTTIQNIQNDIDRLSQQLPEMTNTGDFSDIAQIYEQYLKNPSIILQDKETLKKEIEMIKGDQEPPQSNNVPALPSDEPKNIVDPGGKEVQKSDNNENPFKALKGFGGLIGGILGGIAKLAGMFVGGIAAGQYNGGRK